MIFVLLLDKDVGVKILYSCYCFHLVALIDQKRFWRFSAAFLFFFN